VIKMKKLSDIFEVHYGTNHELNGLVKDCNGINFVSRTSENNGVSAKVRFDDNDKPIPAGVLTVAGGGSVLETFLQPEPFYSGRDLYYLTPKEKMSVQEKIFYCCCIKANKYRYNYGRQANRTLKDISIPSRKEIPTWVKKSKISDLTKHKRAALNKKPKNLNTNKWKYFKLKSIFDIKKGRRTVKAKLKQGKVPFIAAIDSNNGRRELFEGPAIFKNNTITVNYNGGVAEAFYQPIPFWASDDVNVLYPKSKLTPFIAMFIITIIKKEKYRFNYGRKWKLERMNESPIKLPSLKNGKPNWAYMETFIKSLPFSSSI
jgi:Type I restriction modification DNA specificity domain